jgi:hypothetical protein
MIYQYKDSSGWHSERVDVASPYPTLILDSNGNPHISYLRTTDNTLRYGFHDTLGWHSETVAQIGQGAYVNWHNFDLDSTDHPHLVYNIQGNLIYTFKTSTGWQTQIVDTEIAQDLFFTMGIHEDTLWISYFKTLPSAPYGVLKAAHTPLIPHDLYLPLVHR